MDQLFLLGYVWAFNLFKIPQKVLYIIQNNIILYDTIKKAFIGPKSDRFWIKIGKSFNKIQIVDCRFEILSVDVDFAQIFVVDCRPQSKNVVEST